MRLIDHQATADHHATLLDEELWTTTPPQCGRWIVWNLARDQLTQELVTELPVSIPGKPTRDELVEFCRAHEDAGYHAPPDPSLVPLVQNHFTDDKLDRFDIDPDSAHLVGSVPGESVAAVASGVSLQLKYTRPIPIWVSFDDPDTGHIIADGPNEVVRTHGLPWWPAGRAVFRNMITNDGRFSSWKKPSCLDALVVEPLNPHWRCRPTEDNPENRPWGFARDLDSGTGAAPEAIVEAPENSSLRSICLGTISKDYSTPLYLEKDCA